MKWVLISVGIIALLIVVVLIIGKLLPKKHTATVEQKFTVEKSLLWNRIRNFDKHAEWRTSVSKTEVLNPTKWKEFNKRGEKITFEIIEEVPSERLVSKIVDDDLPFGGEWVFEITESGTQTVLKITENGEVYNPIFRFIGYFFMDESATMKQYMSDLEKSFKPKT